MSPDGSAGGPSKRPRAPRQVRDTSQDPPWLAAISTRSGHIASSPLNLVTILTHDPRWQGVLAWDEMRLAVRRIKPAPWPSVVAPRPPGAKGRPTPPDVWTDTDTTRLCAWFNSAYGMNVGGDSAYRALVVAAERNPVHPVRDYLDGLTFVPLADESRIETWAIRYLGAPDTPYVRRVSAWFLISAVARAYDPGCKVDTMLILEGHQGYKKSSAVQALFGPQWSSDTPPDLHSKDRFEAVRGIWLLEFAELDSLGRADAARVKAFMSSARDRYRRPYGRSDTEAPRSCVFVGTVNVAGRGYLQDETGNRRFWPIACRPCGSGLPFGQVDKAGLEAARDAIWAEAREAYGPGRAEHGRWWPETLEDHALCSEEQAERVARDAWEEPVARYLRARALARQDPFVTLGDVLAEALGVETARQGQPEQNRASRVLVQLGWAKCQARQPDGARVRGFRPAGWG